MANDKKMLKANWIIMLCYNWQNDILSNTVSEFSAEIRKTRTARSNPIHNNILSRNLIVRILDRIWKTINKINCPQIDS